MKHIISNHPGDMLKNFCSTIHILCGFNNFHLVGHNCLRISNTSDAAAFIKSCLTHHHPALQQLTGPKLFIKIPQIINGFHFLILWPIQGEFELCWLGSIFKFANCCSPVLTQLGTCSSPPEYCTPSGSDPTFYKHPTFRKTVPRNSR